MALKFSLRRVSVQVQIAELFQILRQLFLENPRLLNKPQSKLYPDEPNKLLNAFIFIVEAHVKLEQTHDNLYDLAIYFSRYI